MSLSNLIRRKSEPVGFATATLATFATLEGEKGRTVASVAKVAVAKSEKQKTEPSSDVSWRWKIFFANREPLEVCFSPPVARDEVLAWPGAVSAEPLATNVRQQSAPLAASEEAAVRAWLARIEETDPATIGEVIEGCRRDVAARDYFTGRAAEPCENPENLAQSRLNRVL
jgi:hypothetical protein